MNIKQWGYSETVHCFLIVTLHGDSNDIELYQVFAAEDFSEVLSTILPRSRFGDTHYLYINGLFFSQVKSFFVVKTVAIRLYLGAQSSGSSLSRKKGRQRSGHVCSSWLKK